MKNVTPGLILCIVIFCSCTNGAKSVEKDTVVKGNVSTTISSDSSKLSRLINIHDFRPTSVKFKYMLIDNSGQNDRVISVPGPSDRNLQAVLSFDSATIKKLRTLSYNADFVNPGYKAEAFEFDWLDDEEKSALRSVDSNYSGSPDLVFGLGLNGKVWIAGNRVFVINWTN